MRIGINPVKAKQQYEVVLERDDGTQDSMGLLSYNTEDKGWKADGSIRRCIELLTSNKEWRKGNLGSDFNNAALITMEIIAAWYLLTNEAIGSPISIHKLDVPVEKEVGESIDFYRDFRPLSPENVSISSG